MRKGLYILSFLLLSAFALRSQPWIDSAIKRLSLNQHDTARMATLSFISENAPTEVWPPYNRQLGKLSKELLNSTDKLIARKAKFYYAGFLANMGFQEENFGRTDSALVYYLESLKLRLEIDDKFGISNCYNNIGLAYHHKGNMNKALDYYHKALTIQEKINDKLGMGYSLSNIGYLFYNQGEHDQAITYFRKSLAIRKEINDLGGLAFSLLNLGYTFREKGKTDSALINFNECLKIREQIGDKIGICYALNQLAGLQEQTGNPLAALANMNKAAVMQEETHDLAGLTGTLQAIGSLYLREKKYLLAIDYGQRSMKLALRLGYPNDIKNAAALLKNTYEKTGNSRKALEMFELYISMRDSIDSDNIRKENIRKQMHFEYEKKEAEVKAQADAEKEKIKLVAAQEKKRQNIIIISVSVVLLLVMLLAFIIYRNLQKNKEQNRIISEQKDIVEQKQKEILDSIYYASRIQQSLLPGEIIIKKGLKQVKNK